MLSSASIGLARSARTLFPPLSTSISQSPIPHSVPHRNFWFWGFSKSTAPSLNVSNLRKETTFNTALSLRYLPFDADRQPHQRHWCLLGEITAIIPWPLRLCLHIKDMNNEQLLIAFYDNKRGETFAKNPDLKPGRTMAFLYPKFHYFFDGQTGLRIEQSAVQEGRVKILPYTMDTILKVNDKIWEEKDRCQKCQKEGVELNRCARCKSAVYCGKDCQTADWNEHKKLCKAFTEVKWFTDKNWVSASVKNFRF